MFGSPKRKPFIQTAQLSTLVAECVEISGDVAFAGGMRIDGRIRGDVHDRPGLEQDPAGPAHAPPRPSANPTARRRPPGPSTPRGTAGPAPAR